MLAYHLAEARAGTGYYDAGVRAMDDAAIAGQPEQAFLRRRAAFFPYRSRSAHLKRAAAANTPLRTEAVMNCYIRQPSASPAIRQKIGLWII